VSHCAGRGEVRTNETSLVFATCRIPCDGSPEEGRTAKAHLDVWKHQVRLLSGLERLRIMLNGPQIEQLAGLAPVFVNSHSGRDYFSATDVDYFFSGAEEFAKSARE
jgi:hypothetical protein